MGKIIRMKTGLLVPTENLLDKESDLTSFKRLYSCFCEGKQDNVLLFPVRKSLEDEKKFLILDGHHKAIIADLFDVDFSVFIVRDKNDFINKSYFFKDSLWNNDYSSIKRMNENINYRFDYSVKKINPLIDSIKKLRMKHESLESIKRLGKYFLERKL